MFAKKTPSQLVDGGQFIRFDSSLSLAAIEREQVQKLQPHSNMIRQFPEVGIALKFTCTVQLQNSRGRIQPERAIGIREGFNGAKKNRV